MDSVSLPKRESPRPPDSGPSEPQNGECDSKKITELPYEVVAKILSNLGLRDVSTCMRVCQSWRKVIGDYHIQAVSFYHRCHPMPSTPSLLQHVDCYQSSIRDSLKGFGSEGQTAIKKLDQRTNHKCFPKILFFSMARVLTKTKAFTFELRSTISHKGQVMNASFSPDGNHVVTASADKTAKIWGLVDGQWQEKATISHTGWVRNASFSPDGNHVVTASRR